MLSLAQLYKAIDKFYALAQRSYSIFKVAAEENLHDQIEEEIWDKLSNDEFAEQFGRYLENYQEFINALQITPDEFSAILQNADDSDQEENWVDLLDSLQRRYEKLIGSPYLKLDLDDPNWSEELSPKQIVDAINAVANDANTRMYKAGAAAGLSPGDVDESLANRKQGQFMAPTEELKEQKETEVSGRKTEKAREYGARHREKIRTIGKIGLDTLSSQRAALESQIASETNTIKREELQRRLRDLPDPKIFLNYQARQQAQYQKIMADPAKRKEYFDKNVTRQRNTRDFAKKFEALAERYDTSTSPNDKARIRLEVVRLMEQLLQRKNPTLNLDDPWVKNDPEMQKKLNPELILEKYRNRTKKLNKTQLEQRQEHKTKGTLKGLMQKYRESVTSELSQVKFDLNKLFDNDPAVKPFKDAIATAKKHRDSAGLKKAAADLVAFLNGDSYQQIKTNHPAYQAALQMATDMRGWLEFVSQIEKSKVLESGAISPQVRDQIGPVIAQGKQLVYKHAKNASINQRAQDIIQYLEERIRS